MIFGQPSRCTAQVFQDAVVTMPEGGLESTCAGSMVAAACSRFSSSTSHDQTHEQTGSCAVCPGVAYGKGRTSFSCRQHSLQ